MTKVKNNMCSENFSKISIKLWRRLFPVLLQTFFTCRALQGHRKSTLQALGHSKSAWRALERARGGHLKGPWALKTVVHSSTWDTHVLEGHLGEELKAVRHSSTCSFRHLNTQALKGHLDTQAFKVLKHLRCLMQIINYTLLKHNLEQNDKTMTSKNLEGLLMKILILRVII